MAGELRPAAASIATAIPTLDPSSPFVSKSTAAASSSSPTVNGTDRIVHGSSVGRIIANGGERRLPAGSASDTTLTDAIPAAGRGSSTSLSAAARATSGKTDSGFQEACYGRHDDHPWRSPANNQARTGAGKRSSMAAMETSGSDDEMVPESENGNGDSDDDNGSFEWDGFEIIGRTTFNDAIFQRSLKSESIDGDDATAVTPDSQRSVSDLAASTTVYGSEFDLLKLREDPQTPSRKRGLADEDRMQTTTPGSEGKRPRFEATESSPSSMARPTSPPSRPFIKSQSDSVLQLKDSVSKLESQAPVAELRATPPMIRVQLPAKYTRLVDGTEGPRVAVGSGASSATCVENDVAHDAELFDDFLNRPWTLTFALRMGTAKWSYNELIATKDPLGRPSRSRAYRVHLADSFLWLTWPHKGADRLLRKWLNNPIRFRDPVSGRQRCFKFFGSSDSRLRDVPGFGFYEETGGKTVRKMLESFGNLDSVWRTGGPGKWIARLGLNFTDTTPTITVSPDEVAVIRDVFAPDGKAYTDGCGCMTEEAASELSKYLDLQGDVPRAYQIRFAGCKGMLVVHSKENLKRFFPEVYRDDVKIYFRDSQVKYQAPMHRVLEVKDWSKPPPLRGARLQKSYILVLECLGLPLEPIEALLKAHLEKLKVCYIDRKEAIAMLSRLTGLTALESSGAQRLLQMLCAGHDMADPITSSEIEAYLKIFFLSSLRDKLCIPVPSSRILFGVCDDSRHLRAGQVIINEYGRYLTGPVLVTRSPAYHPGDIRLLAAVRPPTGVTYTNCIVFPLDGDQPTADMMGGGDLDGDTFMVIDDDTLFPPNIHAPNPRVAPPEGMKPMRSATVDHSQIISHMIVRTNNKAVGKISTHWIDVAEKSALGPRDPFCLALADAAEAALDSNKAGTEQLVVPLRQDYPKEQERTKGPLGLLDEQIHVIPDRASFDGHRTDPDLLLPCVPPCVPRCEEEKHWEEEYRFARKVREDWGPRFGATCGSDDPDPNDGFSNKKTEEGLAREKCQRKERLRAEFVREYFWCENARDYSRYQIRASAWYAYIYDGYDKERHALVQKQKLRFGDVKQGAMKPNERMFAWLGAEYLNRMKADAVDRRHGKALPSASVCALVANSSGSYDFL